MAEDIFSSIEWKEVENQTVSLLQELVRYKSINYDTVDSGFETPVCEFISSLLTKEGIECTNILESSPGRGNLIARLKATNPDHNLKPLAINVHLDVVPAPVEEAVWKREGWKFDPFGAHINEEDGCLYGRGTIDMKNMGAMTLAIMIFLKRKRIPLKRDLVLIACADEEAGGKYGAQWLVNNYPAEVECDVMLGEGGGMNIFGKNEVINVNLGEKGSTGFKLIAKGPAGHASVPTLDNPIYTISSVAEQLITTPLPFRCTDIVTESMTELSKQLPFPKNRILPLILNSWFSNCVIGMLPEEKQSPFIAMLHNTAVPTIVNGGVKINQVPSRCELSVNGRVLPGVSQEDYFREIREVLGPSLFEPTQSPDGIIPPKLEIEVLYFSEGFQQPTTDPRIQPFFRIIEEAIIKHTNSVGVACPFLLPATTDLRHFIRHPTHTPVCIGFLPTLFPANSDFVKLYHGVNERISVESLKWGVRVLYDTIVNICK